MCGVKDKKFNSKNFHSSTMDQIVLKGLWHETFWPFLSSLILNRYFFSVRWRFLNFSFALSFYYFNSKF
jgi:hypothetical protein